MTFSRVRGVLAAAAAAWVLGAAAGPAFAAETRVAVINVEQVFAQYKRPALLEQEIRLRQQQVVSESDKRRESLERKRQALDAFKPDSADYKAKLDEVRREEVEFQVWRTMEEDALKRQHKESFMAIYADVRTAVAKVAQRDGYDLVLTYDTLTDESPDSQALRQQILLQKVIFWKPQIDVTEAVLKVLNDEFDAAQKSPGGAPAEGGDKQGASKPPQEPAKDKAP